MQVFVILSNINPDTHAAHTPGDKQFRQPVEQVGLQVLFVNEYPALQTLHVEESWQL